MPTYVLFAAVAVGLSLPLLWYSVSSASAAPKSVLAEDLARLPLDAREAILQRGAGERLGLPFLRTAGLRLRRMSPVGWLEAMQHHLTLAGRTGSYSLERMLIGKLLLAAAGGVAGFVLVGPFLGVNSLLFAVVLAALGFFVPDMTVVRQGRDRQERILLALPDTLDQIRMSVDAGLGFEAAVARSARTSEGPLAQELSRTLREIQLGVPRPQALRNLAERTDVTDLDSFVIAVVQAEQYGIPISQVLRVQSDELRDKRSQRAEERAMKIPVLLIFPLAFCIFPAMFIVLLGPAAIRIFRDLGPALTGG